MNKFFKLIPVLLVFVLCVSSMMAFAGGDQVQGDIDDPPNASEVDPGTSLGDDGKADDGEETPGDSIGNDDDDGLDRTGRN